MTIDDLKMSDKLKADIKNTANDLIEILETENEELIYWTQYYDRIYLINC